MGMLLLPSCSGRQHSQTHTVATQPASRPQSTLPNASRQARTIATTKMPPRMPICVLGGSRLNMPMRPLLALAAAGCSGWSGTAAESLSSGAAAAWGALSSSFFSKLLLLSSRGIVSLTMSLTLPASLLLPLLPAPGAAAAEGRMRGEGSRLLRWCWWCAATTTALLQTRRLLATWSRERPASGTA